VHPSHSYGLGQQAYPVTSVKAEQHDEGVVKKEMLKLLKARVIYPIFDSEWVSPVQVVPKKGGMTIVHNEKNELILSGRSLIGICALILENHQGH
jgi:hypothetical protein